MVVKSQIYSETRLLINVWMKQGRKFGRGGKNGRIESSEKLLRALFRIRVIVSESLPTGRP